LKTITLLLFICLPLFAQDGVGTEEDPFLLDIDSLIKAGFVVTVSPMDTIVYEPTPVDTIRVTAKALRVSEVVKIIGEKMRENRIAAGGMTYTTHEEFVLHNDNSVKIFNSLTRIHESIDGQTQRLRIRGSSKEYENGKLIKETLEEEMEELWPDSQNTISVGMDMPFSITEGGSYRYEILDRILIGNNLVYKLSFESKSRFKPHFFGTVWIDYSDFVIRRMEASMDGIMPIPVLKNVPHFLMIQEKIDGYWVPTEMSFLANLRGGLPMIPDKAQMKSTSKDFIFESGGK
jgi:hypothetical protein